MFPAWQACLQLLCWTAVLASRVPIVLRHSSLASCALPLPPASRFLASLPRSPLQTLANMEALERMFGLAEEEGMSPAQAQKVKAAAGKR